MTVRYETRRPDDLALRARMKAIAQERRRFGYRRLLVMLRREGLVVNHKKLFRLYREEGLTVRKRRTRRRAVGTRAPILVEARPNAQVAGLRARPVRLRAALSGAEHRR